MSCFLHLTLQTSIEIQRGPFLLLGQIRKFVIKSPRGRSQSQIGGHRLSFPIPTPAPKEWFLVFLFSHFGLTSKPRRFISLSQSIKSFSGFNRKVFSARIKLDFSRVRRISFFRFQRHESEQNFICRPESGFWHLRHTLDFRAARLIFSSGETSGLCCIDGGGPASQRSNSAIFSLASHKANLDKYKSSRYSG